MAAYYVKNGGNDGADGLSDANAWATIGKVNGSSFSAGDNILFKRGDTFTDAVLAITWSGTLGNPITVGAYGSGARPIISILNDHSIYISTLRSYIAIESIDCNVNSTGNYGAQVKLANSTITDCLFHNADVGLGIDGPSDNVVVTDCVAYDNDDFGILIDGTLSQATNIILDACEAYNNGYVSINHGIYVSADTDGCIVRRCISHDNAAYGIFARNGTTSVLIERNRVYSNDKAGIQIQETVSSNNSIRYNLSYSNGEHGIALGIDCVDVAIYNNTLVNNTLNGIKLEETTTLGNTIKNNLVVQDYAVVGDGNNCIRGPAAAVQGNTLDYNCYIYLNDPGSTPCNQGGDEYSFSAWQALTGSPDPNSISSDPLFLTEFTNLHLQSSSLCIDAGTPIAGLTVDFDGIPLGRGTNPDIGAFETLKGGPRGL